jgi:transcription elongation factor Elf1
MRDINVLHPVNRSAALVVQGGVNEASFLQRRETHICSKVPLPTVDFTGYDKSHDLTNKIFCRLIVIGVFPAIGKNKSRKTTWVTKCSCGKYEVYKGSTLRNGIVSCCSECRYTIDLRNSERKELMKRLRQVYVEPCIKCNGEKSDIQCNYKQETKLGFIICNNCGNKVNFVAENRISGFQVWNLKNKQIN